MTPLTVGGVVDDDTMKPKHAVHTCINLFKMRVPSMKAGVALPGSILVPGTGSAGSLPEYF